MAISGRKKFQVEFLRISQNILERGLYVLLYKKYPDVIEEKNIRYDPSGKRTELDIIRKRPADEKEKRPLFIYVHGGGWLSGWKAARRFYCRYWASRGYVCANIGYDYALDASHPKNIRQIFKGIELVLNDAERLNLNTEKTVVAGESAGGYFAAMIAAASTHRELYGLLEIPFAFKDSFKVSACVLMSGIFDPVRALDTKFPSLKIMTETFCGLDAESLRSEEGKKLRKTLAPSYYADRSFPPSFLIGSKFDLLLPETLTLRDELDASGVENELFVCGGINGVHAGGLGCHVGSGKKAVEGAVDFVSRF